MDLDKGELMQTLRTSNNEDEVTRAVEALEKGGALTLKDYTTLLTALKRIKHWQVSGGTGGSRVSMAGQESTCAQRQGWEGADSYAGRHVDFHSRAGRVWGFEGPITRGVRMKESMSSH
jgi:hypothetical protein